jgi:hypothetical protein
MECAAREWVASPFQGEAEGEGLEQATDGCRWQSPHLTPLPLSTGRGGQTNIRSHSLAEATTERDPPFFPGL